MPNKSSVHGGTISEGTVIHGTLRTQDLLDAFGAELYRVLPFNGRRLVAEAADWVRILNEPDASDHDHQCADEVLLELFDQLDSIAQKEGLTFGAHEGDGSDFGYWQIEPEND
jgi:hypothetical protein